jgi:HAD superfamily phosphoserine phosphatase-like hydrolase
MLAGAVFVDYDGTITGADTFDLLVRRAVGEEEWNALDAALLSGELPLREVLRRQAAFVRLTQREALAYLAEHAPLDPTFADFVARCAAANWSVTVLSSGIRSIIVPLLEAAGLGHVPVIANDVDFAPEGWAMSFIDAVDNGTDKAARVVAAKAQGLPTIFIGDGISDFDAAVAADIRYAKRGRSLEQYLGARTIAFRTFASFSDIASPQR